jgi:hypothetical protein
MQIGKSIRVVYVEPLKAAVPAQKADDEPTGTPVPVRSDRKATRPTAV